MLEKIIMLFMGKFVPSRILSEQAKKPSGWFGKNFVAYFFKKVNADLLDFMMSIYKYKNTDVVCDIGFGPGELFLPLSRKVHKVAGIDFSKDMVKLTVKKYKKIIARSLSFLSRDDKI